MKNERLFKFSAAAVAVVAALVFVASTQEDPSVLAPSKPKPEKLCPITFHLDPVTSLQINFSAAIEKTNADLAIMLANLRADVSRANMKFSDEDVKSFVSKHSGVFSKSYLKQPILRGDDGKERRGWGEIIAYLADVIPSTTYLHPQAVNVYLRYLPIKDKEYGKWNAGIMKPEDLPNEIDFLASIRTVIAYAPYDDPMVIGNELPIPHRKICDPIY